MSEDKKGCPPSGSESPHRESSNSVEASRDVAPLDIIALLRAANGMEHNEDELAEWCWQAADEISRLRGKIKGLQEVLDHACVGEHLAEIKRLSEENATLGAEVDRLAGQLNAAWVARVTSVSDGDPEGRDLGLGAKPASAVCEAETPSLLPQSPEEGMVLVPREPTEEMLRAAYEHMASGKSPAPGQALADLYRVMIAASSHSQEQEKGSDAPPHG